MLGWEVFIRRPIPGVPLDKLRNDRESALAHWETGLYGMDWAEELAKEGKAVQVAFGGYPCTYIATARDLLPKISAGPPPNDCPPVIGEDYFLPANWNGKIEVNHDKLGQCSPDTQLVIEAWDLS